MPYLMEKSNFKSFFFLLNLSYGTGGKVVVKMRQEMVIFAKGEVYFMLMFFPINKFREIARK